MPSTISSLFAPRVAARWSPATGVAVRGTIAVLPEAGQHGEEYEALARHLAVDGFEVVTLDALPTTSPAELVDLLRTLAGDASLTLLGAEATMAEIALLAGDLVRPLAFPTSRQSVRVQAAAIVELLSAPVVGAGAR